MVEPKRPDLSFDTMTSRLLRREALRRAAEELNTTTPGGLENLLARISAEVTAEAGVRAAEPSAVPAFVEEPRRRPPEGT